MDTPLPDRDRRIFSFFDGTRTVRVDPVPLHRRVLRAMDNQGIVLEDTLKSMESEDDLVALEAMGRLVPALRAAFRLPSGRAEGDDDGFELAEGCLADEEVLSVFNDFLEFQLGLKKNSGTPPNGSPSSDGPPADSHSASDSTTTPATTADPDGDGWPPPQDPDGYPERPPMPEHPTPSQLAILDTGAD